MLVNGHQITSFVPTLQKEVLTIKKKNSAVATFFLQNIIVQKELPET